MGQLLVDVPVQPELIPDPLGTFTKWCKRPRVMDQGSGN